MEIIRADYGDTDIFDADRLAFGACCFYSKDRACKYFFQINGREATLFANTNQYVNEAIQEFLFYSGFITAVKDESDHVLATNAPNAPYLLDISHIQPSQFYINEKKLAACKGWIKSPEDILIPIAIKDGKNIALDGHTRLKAALDLGYTSVYVYTEPYDEGIFHFVDEALRRGITGVASMEVVSDVEYATKWDKFCDDYFAEKK